MSGFRHEALMFLAGLWLVGCGGEERPPKAPATPPAAAAPAASAAVDAQDEAALKARFEAEARESITAANAYDQAEQLEREIEAELAELE